MGSRKRLDVDMDEVLDAMERNPNDPCSYFLNRDTGTVIACIEDDYGSESDEAREDIDNAPPGRFEQIPQTPVEYGWMRDFAKTVDDDELRARLEVALSGRGAFGRFRDVVFGDRELRNLWLHTKREALLREALHWFESIGVEPIYELRPIAKTPASPVPKRRTTAVPVTVVDLLLLGAPDGKTELIDGRVLRRVTLTDPSTARGAFRSLARELCELAGIDWRRRFVEGTDRVEFGRARLSIDGATIELAVEVTPQTWNVFRRRA